MILGAIIALVALFIGLVVGLIIKQRFYEVLLKHWSDMAAKRREENYQQLVTTIDAFDDFYTKHKTMVEEILKRR